MKTAQVHHLMSGSRSSQTFRHSLNLHFTPGSSSGLVLHPKAINGSLKQKYVKQIKGKSRRATEAVKKQKYCIGTTCVCVDKSIYVCASALQRYCDTGYACERRERKRERQSWPTHFVKIASSFDRKGEIPF